MSNTGTWMQRVAQDWLVLAARPATAAPRSASPPGCSSCRSCCSRRSPAWSPTGCPKRRLLQLTQTRAWRCPPLVLGVLAVTGTRRGLARLRARLRLRHRRRRSTPRPGSRSSSEIVGPDDLTNAVGLNSATFNAARLVGPALAGLLIAAFGGGVGRDRLGDPASTRCRYAAPILVAAARCDASRAATPPSRRPAAQGEIREGVALRARPART